MPIPRQQSGEGRNSFLSGRQDLDFKVPEGVVDIVKQETEKNKKEMYEGYEVSKETYDFLESLEEQIGENKVLKIINRRFTLIENGDLVKLYCYDTQITSLPELPASLQKLDCSHTPLSRNPEEKDKLKKYCKEHNIFLSI